MEHLSWNPGKILEMSGSYWYTCALHAAVKLDLFSALGSERLTVAEVAQRVNADTRALAMILNALASMELLAKRGELYANTSAAPFLCKDSPDYLGYIIQHHHHLMESWARLPEAVRTGRPVRTRSSHSDDEKRASFLMGMYNLAMTIAPQVAVQIDLTGRRRLLDMGGGPGTYAIHFCLHNPDLRATVYDLVTTRPFALKTIESFGLNDRIEFQAGDYEQEELTGRYDVAWLSQILHSAGPDVAAGLVRKAASVLDPGGLIFIHEFILNDSQDGPPFPALFSLNMLLGTENGQSYSQAQLTDMLRAVGIGRVERLAFRGPNDSGIIMGTVE
jgi:hypothetical protein